LLRQIAASAFSRHEPVSQPGRQSGYDEKKAHARWRQKSSQQKILAKAADRSTDAAEEQNGPYSKFLAQPGWPRQREFLSPGK